MDILDYMLQGYCIKVSRSLPADCFFVMQTLDIAVLYWPKKMMKCYLQYPYRVLPYPG